MVAAALGTLLVGAAPAGADPGPPIHKYVALGDSYAAGPLIPDQVGTPADCLRSDHNYASDVAGALDVRTFVDASCSGAVTADMTTAQGDDPPQFNALTHDTSLVTITIGGNDIGFVSIVTTCAELSFADPTGNPCQQHYTAGGTDQLAAAISALAPKVAAVLSGIRTHARHATVVVVGYLRILPPTIGCWPVMPISAGDVPYLTSVENELNAMLGAQARAAGDQFVNSGAPTGHDVCQLPGTKWVEGLTPTSPAAPVHPNASGMAAVADLVEHTLGR
ncbi:MAG TPA: SGNH/GDSL hydrolase family protein [Pseudonocardiaceae bacterium]|nr:SGNH/GDSL hydrolase family protein [Pseudonocardiaceae bacterium]